MPLIHLRAGNSYRVEFLRACARAVRGLLRIRESMIPGDKSADYGKVGREKKVLTFAEVTRVSHQGLIAAPRALVPHRALY